MHPDHAPYFRFTKKSQLDKAIHSLVGIVEGIAIDGRVTDAEHGFLRTWLADSSHMHQKHPFNELVPAVSQALADGVLSPEERDDLLWLCSRLDAVPFQTQAKADLQRLHAVLGGIVGDGRISEAELRGLAMWLADHEDLRTCWPYDEVDALVTSVLTDGRIDEQEHALLKDFFSDFVAVMDERTIVTPRVAVEGTVRGVCAVAPEITVRGSSFCLTGASVRYTRQNFQAVIERHGGQVCANVVKDLNYLVIGADGNPCWAFACYGRKVERAVQLRKAGARLLLVHENDLHDALADCA